MRSRRHPWLTDRPVAHRGLHSAEAPENSMGAFQRAVEAGFPIELDVLGSADGRAVVIHDTNLRRLTGKDAMVRDMAAADLRGLRLAGTSHGIPVLEEVLDLVAGRVGILVEVKVRRFDGSVERSVARAIAGYRGPLAVQSFNPHTLAWFRLRCPQVPRGQLSCVFDTDPMAGWKKAVLALYGMNWLTAPHFIAHQFEKLPAIVPGLLRRWIPVLTWTVRSPEAGAQAGKVADNYIFEGFLPPMPAHPPDRHL